MPRFSVDEHLNELLKDPEFKRLYEQRKYGVDGPSTHADGMPVMKTMCATCPFKDGSPYSYLVPGLSQSALTESSRICHSTGTNAIGGETGVPNHGCRGARDLQIDMFHALGVLEEPTDECWQRTWETMKKELGI